MDRSIVAKSIVWNTAERRVEDQDGDDGLLDGGCRVAGDIVDGELVNVRCKNDDCSGTCTLHSETSGSTTRYHCTCD